MCDDECEGVVHVLWDCPAYKKGFMEELSNLLGSKFSQFLCVEIASFLLGSELWEDEFFGLVKRYIVDVGRCGKVSFMVMIHVPVNFSLSTQLRI